MTSRRRPSTILQTAPAHETRVPPTVAARGGPVVAGPPKRTLVSAARAAYLALRSTGFRLWWCSMPDGALQLLSRTSTNGHGDLGYHIHPEDLGQVAMAYEAARVNDEPFDLDCRISDRHGVSYHSHCWFGLRVGRGAQPERLIVLERRPGSRGPDGRAAQEPPPPAELAHDDPREGELLAFVAHQLRSPITTILGNAHVLRFRSHDLTRDQREQALDDLVDSTDRLCKLLDDLLRFGGMAGISHSNGQVAAISLPDVVSEVIERHARSDPSRELRHTVPSVLPAALGSVGYVDQIVDNLLTNARKYSPPGTPIDVVLESDGDRVNVRVLDRGIGIDPNEAERIFTPFYRSARVTGLAEGSGIGLSVSKQLADALAASITARARAGGGSEFVLSLQRAPAVLSIADDSPV